MKQFVQALLLALGFCIGCSKGALVTPGQFTKDYAQALNAAMPDAKIEVVKDLELKLVPTNGHEQSIFLYNAYDMYKSDPGSKDKIIKKFTSVSQDATASSEAPVDRTRIVPVIKDRPWLENTRQASSRMSAKKSFEPIHEDLNPDLIILYVEDTPKSMRFLSPEDLTEAKIEQKDLRALACENLDKLLTPKLNEGTNGIYLVTAGGNYEASLLLLDSIWNTNNFDVKGDFVVAIPNRDMLLVTGTGNSAGIAQIRKFAKKFYAEGSYHLTPKLFVRRNGTFAELSE